MNIPFQLEDNEVITNKIGRHWIDLASPLIAACGLFAAGFGLTVGANFYSQLIPANIIPYFSLNIIDWLSMVLIGLGSLILLVGYWVYKQNYLLLTNMHLIEVKQVGLFGREVSQLGLGRLQDVTGRRLGFWATVLNYGDVLVQTAAETGEFNFSHVPAPQTVADMCRSAHDDYIRDHPEQNMI
jgi:hypothetical protein